MAKLKMPSFEAIGKHSLEFCDSYPDVQIIYAESISCSAGIILSILKTFVLLVFFQVFA